MVLLLLALLLGPPILESGVREKIKRPPLASAILANQYNLETTTTKTNMLPPHILHFPYNNNGKNESIRSDTNVENLIVPSRIFMSCYPSTLWTLYCGNGTARCPSGPIYVVWRRHAGGNDLDDTKQRRLFHYFPVAFLR